MLDVPDIDKLHPSTDETLVRFYPRLADVGADLGTLSSSGWRVDGVQHPLDTRPLHLPICILRRVSKRHRYRVTYVRHRS